MKSFNYSKKNNNNNPLMSILVTRLAEQYVIEKTIHGEKWVCNFDILDCFKRQINFPSGAISNHAWLAIFIYNLSFYEGITKTNYFNNNF